MDLDQIVGKYVELRDAKDELKEKHKAELAPYTEMLSKLEGMLLGALDKAGLQSAKTPHGTAFKSTTTSAKVIDWDKTLDYIVEHERFDLVQRRVNKDVVEEIGDVPGVAIEKILKVNVRRS